MDIFLRSSALMLSLVTTLRRADPPSKECYQLSARYVILILILDWRQAREPSPIKEEEEENEEEEGGKEMEEI
jgi:hypothetical protein